MVNITITIQGTAEEMKPVLKFLSQEQSSSVAVIDKDKTDTFWTEDKIRKVWNGLSTDCKNILLDIANNTDSPFRTWVNLATKYNVSPQTIGGRLSSLGHQIRINNYQNLPHPLIVEDQGYKLDPVWKYAIIKIEGEVKESINNIKKLSDLAEK